MESIRDKFQEWRTNIRNDLNESLPVDADKMLPPIKISDMVIYKRDPGPITLENVLNAVPPTSHWFFNLFLNWLDLEYNSVNSDLVTIDGCLNMREKMISYSFCEDTALEKYRPEHLWRLYISKSMVKTAYFDDNLLITDRDLATIAAFIENCPNCTLVSLSNNRFGIKDIDDPKLIAQIRRLLQVRFRPSRDNPDLIVNLIGNPCVKFNSKLFQVIEDREIAQLQFISRSDFRLTHWQELFKDRPSTVKIVEDFHAKLYSD